MQLARRQRFASHFDTSDAFASAGSQPQSRSDLRSASKRALSAFERSFCLEHATKTRCPLGYMFADLLMSHPCVSLAVKLHCAAQSESPMQTPHGTTITCREETSSEKSQRHQTPHLAAVVCSPGNVACLKHTPGYITRGA